MKSFAATEH